MNTTNEPAGIDLDNAALDNLEALARAVDDLPETTQPFVSMGGQVVIHTFSMSPEQVRAVANLYDAATPATIVALIALARRAPAPVAVALDKDAEKQRFITWGQVFHRNARSYTARDFDHGLAAWLAAKADAVAQQSPAPVVAHDAPTAPVVAADDEAARLRKVLIDVRHALQFANENPGGGINDTLWMMHTPETLFDFIDAALAQPEGATGTTGASIDTPEFCELLHEVCALFIGDASKAKAALVSHIDAHLARMHQFGRVAASADYHAEIADLRAQLAAKGQGAIFREIVQSIIGDGYLSETNMHRGRLALDGAAPAQPSPINRVCDILGAFPADLLSRPADQSNDRAMFDSLFDLAEFNKEYAKYGPAEAAFTVWQYARASALAAPAAIEQAGASTCNWPSCLSKEEQDKLADEVARSMNGESVEQAGAQPVAWGNFKEDGTCVALSQHPEDIARWQNPRALYLAAPTPATDQYALDKLGGAIKMAVNMLTRDGTPVRIEAAGALIAAFGEVAATPVTDQPKQEGQQ